LCGNLPKKLSHSRVNPQLAIAQLVDSVSEIGADWVIASQDCFGWLCNPVSSKYHSLQPREFLWAKFPAGISFQILNIETSLNRMSITIR